MVWDPTMEGDQQAPIISSPNPTPNNNLRIYQQFFQLQRHWNHYKTSSNHRSPPPTMLPLPNDSSPEDDLISSLQRHGTATFSASSTWKIRTNELAQDEILRERRAAMATGKFKGRRLSFDDVDKGLGLNSHFLHGNYWNGFLQDQIVAPSIQSSDSGEDNCNREMGKEKEEVPVCLNGLSYSSASSSSSSSSGSFVPLQMKEEIAAKVEENVTPTVGEKKEIGNWCKIGKWEVGLAWLAIALVAMIIFSVRCLEFGAYDEERLPFLLVPT